MKWVLRFFVTLHIGFILYGTYTVFFAEEYIYASKYIFIGVLGVFVFTITFLLLPLNEIQKKMWITISFLLYLFTAFGFWQPIILKNYWEILLSIALLVTLNSVYIRLVINKKKWETAIYTLATSLLVLPILFGVSSFFLFTLSAVLLAFVSIYLLYKVAQN